MLDRRGARAEALVLDLWIERPGGGHQRAFDGAGQARLTGGGWLIEPEDGAEWKFEAAAAALAAKVPATPGTIFDDVDGDGEEDEPIPVTGERPRSMDEDEDWGWIPNGDDGSSGPGDATGGPPGNDQEQNDCRDRKALDAKNEINGDSNKNYYEHGSIIYRDATGVVQQSSIMQGATDHITIDMIEQAMSDEGISFSQVIGFVHNHPSHTFGGYNAPVNRYPSGGDVPGGDWNTADWFVGNGAGGPGGENFALYVIDTDGQMREFDYSDKEIYKNLDASERRNGENLPGQVVNDGSSCG